MTFRRCNCQPEIKIAFHEAARIAKASGMNALLFSKPLQGAVLGIYLSGWLGLTTTASLVWIVSSFAPQRLGEVFHDHSDL